MDSDRLQKVLGREVNHELIRETLGLVQKYSEERILITGGDGSIGLGLRKFFLEHDIDAVSTDVEDMDVTNADAVLRAFSRYRPTIVFHVAGAKHAPHGEFDPMDALNVNTYGTRNILKMSQIYGGKVVLTSTCKACNPETSYGASKMIAERMVLNAGGNVARFYNVVQSSGNVFEIWNDTPGELPIHAMDCERYFIDINEAVALVLFTGVLKTGRYTIDPGKARSVIDIAEALYPGRVSVIPRRRGDRIREPLMATNEESEPVLFGINKIVSSNDAM